MKRKKLPYREGTWFAVPLRDKGWAIGRVARMSGNGLIIGYFFGPRRHSPPSLDEIKELTPDKAKIIGQLGDLGLIRNEWVVIGEESIWRREDWPIPLFIRKDPLSKSAWLVEYADDNPMERMNETRVPYETEGYPPDSTWGSGAAEIRLTKLMGDSGGDQVT